MNQKLSSLNYFVDKVKKASVAKNIARIIHYGSTASDGYSKESDIDLLLVATGDVKKVEEVVDELSYETLLEIGERVEPLVYCLDDYLYPSYFLYKVREKGKEVFSMDETQIRRNEAFDLISLAKRYNKMARNIYSPENLRGVVDFGYNSAELCAKAFILAEGEDLPKTHSGIITKFSELFVKTKRVDIEIGRILNIGLDRRNRARYNAHTTISDEDANSLLNLSDRLIILIEEELANK